MEQNEKQPEGIKVPDGLLSKFGNDEDINGFDGPDPGPMDGFVTDLAEKSIEKLASAFDETMKDRGGVGMAGIPEKDFAKLGVIALEDVIPKEVLENSPKAAFGVMCTYIAGANAVAIKRNNAKKESETPEDNE